MEPHNYCQCRIVPCQAISLASNNIRDTGYAPTTVHRIESNLRNAKTSKMKDLNPRNDRIRTQRFLGLETINCCKSITANGSAGENRNMTRMTFCRRLSNIPTTK